MWLKMEPDKVSRLTLCKMEESMRQGEVPQLEEGDSVVVWWEGDLFRGVIIKILEEGSSNLSAVSPWIFDSNTLTP